MTTDQWLRSAGRSLATFAILVGLGACGGGGGAGDGGRRPDSPAVIDAGNAATITREVVSVGLDAGAFGGVVGGGGILSADGGSNALAQSLAQSLVRHRATIQQVQPAASVGPETFDCLVSGTVRLSGSLNSEFTLTPGDRISIAFSHCDDADGAVYDGRMRLAVASFSGDILNNVYALGAAVTFTDLAITAGGGTLIGDGTLDIDLDLTVPLISATAESGSLFGFRRGSDAWILRDFALSTVEDATGASLLTRISGTGTLEGSRFEGAVNFVTLSPLVATGDDYPATGEVLITGANSATIRATVQTAQTVQLAIDLNGDGLVDDTQQVPWSSLGGF